MLPENETFANGNFRIIHPTERHISYLVPTSSTAAVYVHTAFFCFFPVHSIIFISPRPTWHGPPESLTNEELSNRERGGHQPGGANGSWLRHNRILMGSSIYILATDFYCTVPDNFSRYLCIWHPSRVCILVSPCFSLLGCIQLFF